MQHLRVYEFNQHPVTEVAEAGPATLRHMQTMLGFADALGAPLEHTTETGGVYTYNSPTSELSIGLLSEINEANLQIKHGFNIRAGKLWVSADNHAPIVSREIAIRHLELPINHYIENTPEYHARWLFGCWQMAKEGVKNPSWRSQVERLLASSPHPLRTATTYACKKSLEAGTSSGEIEYERIDGNEAFFEHERGYDASRPVRTVDIRLSKASQEISYHYSQDFGGTQSLVEVLPPEITGTAAFPEPEVRGRDSFRNRVTEAKARRFARALRLISQSAI